MAKTKIKANLTVEIDDESADFQNDEIRELLFKKYSPLMHKIVNQLKSSMPLDYNDVIGAAMEGFVYAMNSFKRGTSQSFKQYSAWCMRNFILSSANSEGHTVKFSAYNQKKAKERGESTFKSVSMNNFTGDSEDDSRLSILGVDEDTVFDETPENAYSALYQFVDENFTVRDRTIFYSTYGLNGHDVVKGKDLADKFKMSAASVSLINKRVINAIKKAPELLEKLLVLLK